MVNSHPPLLTREGAFLGKKTTKTRSVDLFSSRGIITVILNLLIAQSGRLGPVHQTRVDGIETPIFPQTCSHQNFLASLSRETHSHSGTPGFAFLLTEKSTYTNTHYQRAILIAVPR